MTSQEITLTGQEIRSGADCAKRKMNYASKRKLRDQQGGSSMESELLGVYGEIAFSKWIGVPFECHIGSDKGTGDVLGVEVKTARTDYGLVVHENDPDSRPIVLLIGDVPTFRMVGWIRAKDGRRPEWFKNPGNRRAAWFVPIAALRSPDELYEPLRKRASQRGLIEGGT